MSRKPGARRWPVPPRPGSAPDGHRTHRPSRSGRLGCPGPGRQAGLPAVRAHRAGRQWSSGAHPGGGWARRVSRKDQASLVPCRWWAQHARSSRSRCKGRRLRRAGKLPWCRCGGELTAEGGMGRRLLPPCTGAAGARRARGRSMWGADNTRSGGASLRDLPFFRLLHRPHNGRTGARSALTSAQSPPVSAACGTGGRTGRGCRQHTSQLTRHRAAETRSSPTPGDCRSKDTGAIVRSKDAEFQSFLLPVQLLRPKLDSTKDLERMRAGDRFCR